MDIEAVVGQEIQCVLGFSRWDFEKSLPILGLSSSLAVVTKMVAADPPPLCPPSRQLSSLSVSLREDDDVSLPVVLLVALLCDAELLDRRGECTVNRYAADVSCIICW